MWQTHGGRATFSDPEAGSLVENTVPIDRTTSFTAVLWVYVLALAVGTWVAVDLSDWHPLGQMLWADIAATGAVFLCAFSLNNTSTYDPYWSVAPFPIALWFFAPHGGVPGREWLVAALLLVWGARLTNNFARGWPGLHHEDWRYDTYRSYGPFLYWPISLFGLHLVPTLTVYAAMLPVWAASEGTAPLGPVTWLGAAICVASVILAEVADVQLMRFRDSNPPSDAVLDTGLWAVVRNPNYLGEIGFWWGLWLIGFGAGWVYIWTVVGPMLVTGLFVQISIPLKERRMAERRGENWSFYVNRTPRLIPGLW